MDVGKAFGLMVQGCCCPFHEDAPASQTRHFPDDKSTHRSFSLPILVQTDIKSLDFELGFIQTPGSDVQGWLEHRESAWDGLNVPAAAMDHSSQPLTQRFGAEIFIFHSLVWILGFCSHPESWQRFPQLPSPSGAAQEWLCWSWREDIPSKPSFSCCSGRKMRE